jgi:hypothetical protein
MTVTRTAGASHPVTQSSVSLARTRSPSDVWFSGLLIAWDKAEGLLGQAQVDCSAGDKFSLPYFKVTLWQVE